MVTCDPVSRIHGICCPCTNTSTSGHEPPIEGLCGGAVWNPSRFTCPAVTGGTENTVGDGVVVGKTSEYAQPPRSHGKWLSFGHSIGKACYRGVQTPAAVSGHLVLDAKTVTFTFNHLADALIQSDLEYRDILPEASRAKCLAQGHNIVCIDRESNWQPSDY